MRWQPQRANVPGQWLHHLSVSGSAPHWLPQWLHRQSTRAASPKRRLRTPLVFVPFVYQIFNLESAQVVPLLDFQNVGDSFSGRFDRGTEVGGNGLALRQGFQRPFDDLFGRAIRTSRKLLLQQLLAVRCQVNRAHGLSIREVSDSGQRKGAPAIGALRAGHLPLLLVAATVNPSADGLTVSLVTGEEPTLRKALSGASTLPALLRPA